VLLLLLLVLVHGAGQAQAPADSATEVDEATAPVQVLEGRVSAGDLQIYRINGLKKGEKLYVHARVTSGHLDPLVETVAKMRTLETFKEREGFEPLLGTVKRVVNILKEPVDMSVDPQRFVNQAEKDLYENLIACEQDLEKPLAFRDYDAVLNRLSQLKAPIDGFFDEVLVLDQDLALRQNRLALLTRIANLFQQMADFSRIAL